VGVPEPTRRRDQENEVRFLPNHDQWMPGPGTQDDRVTPASRRDLMTRKANPVIAGGVVCGTWSHRGDELTVTWLDERPRPEQEIEREAERLAGVLGGNVILRGRRDARPG
jgi:hypothetical protein